MNGDGSQANPWIITTWDELISDNRQNTDYCEWHGGDINLNDIRPQGYTSGVVIKGRIDFKGATIRNYCCSLVRYSSSNEFGIRFNTGANSTSGYVKNLNLLNMYMRTNGVAPFITFSGSENRFVTVTNCRFSGYFIDNSSSSSTSHIIDIPGRSGYTAEQHIDNCAFNIRTQRSGSGTTDLFHTNNAYINNCRFQLDMKMNSNNNLNSNTDNYWGRFTDCKFTGRVYWKTSGLDTSTYVQLTGANCSNNVFLFDFGSYGIQASALNITNDNKKDSQDNYILCYSGGTQCTDAQLGNAQYLSDLGFPIVVPN